MLFCNSGTIWFHCRGTSKICCYRRRWLSSSTWKAKGAWFHLFLPSSAIIVSIRNPNQLDERLPYRRCGLFLPSIFYHPLKCHYPVVFCWKENFPSLCSWINLIMSTWNMSCLYEFRHLLKSVNLEMYLFQISVFCCIINFWLFVDWTRCRWRANESNGKSWTWYACDCVGESFFLTWSWCVCCCL